MISKAYNVYTRYLTTCHHVHAAAADVLCVTVLCVTFLIKEVNEPQGKRVAAEVVVKLNIYVQRLYN